MVLLLRELVCLLLGRERGKLGANNRVSFVDRDMYMRFRGGGVGHVSTQIEDPEADVDGGLPDMDAEEEIVTTTETVGPEEEAGDDVDENDERGSDHSESEEDEANEGEDDGPGENDEEEQDDVEGFGAEQLRQRLQEVILDDLGFSDL